jgi:predicted adenine nucleotide alpha hydrolase (AANH) superfamily ATPase
MWLKDIAGFEKEPERGNRCRECFRIRLEATAHLAGATGFDTVATTLGSSRWKSLEQIAAAGHRATAGYPKLTFWDRNWRKGGLSERRNSLLKENGFYNQQYCGCEFSGMLPAK